MQTTIAIVLSEAIKKLSPTSDSARLDAEILLAFVINVTRGYLYAWPEKELTLLQQNNFNDLVRRRMQGEPVPYIVGRQEFWSLDFNVTTDTLIPRPETELLVELALQKVSGVQINIADLGTGSGVIGIALAHERPEWIVYATDQSAEALAVAQSNAHHLAVNNIFFSQGNWCDALPSVLLDAIISNPPYIAESDKHLAQGGLSFEPQAALVAGQDGLDAIRNIAQQASRYLKRGGLLMLEHGYDQSLAVREILEHLGYQEITSYCDFAGIERVTIGKHCLG